MILTENQLEKETVKSYEKIERLKLLTTKYDLPKTFLEKLESIENSYQTLHQEFREQKYRNFCPLDYKYHSPELVPYISAEGEVRHCAKVQAALMEGMRKFGLAEERNVKEIRAAVPLISAADVYSLEANVTKHDQIAILVALAEYVSKDTANLMHPGTTSYDILDTARAKAYKDCMNEVFMPQAKEFLKSLVNLAEEYADQVQIGRTHDQWTSPVTFGFAVINYAKRVGDRISRIQEAADSLQGKISGIVGTHASLETVVGKGQARDFESYVLGLLGLKPCEASTQITNKEQIIDLAHYVTTLDGVLADLSNSMRSLQRSEINEVTQSDTAKRLGGSSAEPSKNNPITFENANGLWEDVIGGMMTMYHLQVSDHQRDLRGSVQNRFEPTHIVCSTYSTLKKLTKVMNNLMVIPENMERSLKAANKYSIAEALNATLKRHRFPNAHETVKELAKKAKKQKDRKSTRLNSSHYS